jgi:3-phosphoshikimate 1-carboxyvinyltransferase
MPLISHRAGALSGKGRVPGDKSISHRALIIGSVAVGETRIRGLLEGEDVLRTAAAMRALGAGVTREGDGAAGGGVWRVTGRGVGGLAEPAGVLDMGNSGTAARLLMGLVATHPFTSVFTGDASLAERPMERIMEPLRLMGAAFTARSGGRLPVTVLGAADPVPIAYELPVASAQVKSAVLLAGLNTPGRTRVVEPRPTRDHSELMLRHFGAEVGVETLDGGGRAITLTGQPEISGRAVVVPGDISSAAFPLVAALLVPGSDITLKGVGVNPLRGGLLETLRDMGAAITVAEGPGAAGEPVADLRAEAGSLRGVEVPPERAPSMIDEYPVLAVAAACAEGPTRMTGLAELRVKESDRLGAMARGLAACGVKVEETADSLTVHGTGRPPAGGATIAVDLDHRIAMAFLVLGMVSADPVGVDDGGPITTSFPGFVSFMNGLGAALAEDSR